MTRKKKFKHDYGLKNIYQFYKEKYTHPIDYKTFTVVLNLFNIKLIENLFKGSYFNLPYSLGDLFICKYKPRLRFDENGEVISWNKSNMIDYKATKELWEEYPELAHKQRVPYTNFHTDSFKYKIHWKRYHTNRTNRLYNFIPARDVKRSLARYLKSNPNQDYYDK